MKTSSILTFGAALSGTAAASDGYLWTIDASHNRQRVSQVASIASDSATSILAHRRGMTSDRSIGTMDEKFITDLNRFGGHRQEQELFEQHERHNSIFIRISGFDGTLNQFGALPNLSVEGASRELLDDFGVQDNIEGVCEYGMAIAGNSKVELVYSYSDRQQPCPSLKYISAQPDVQLVTDTLLAAKDVTQGMQPLVEILAHLAVTESLESTILVLPAASKLSKPKVSRRAPPSEEPLDLPSSSPAGGATYPSVAASNSSRPLPSAIPDCFSSEESCNKVTNSCSGHGKCFKAHVSCFKCSCGSTTLHENDQGYKKTIQWGGNACQKKDVSVPFVLFASIGILLSALVAGGIGMLQSMGSQDLPSVLGAGVGGPRAQK